MREQQVVVKYFLAVLLVLGAFATTGCPKKLPPVTIDGEELPYEEAALRKYAIAENLYKEGKSAEAQTAFEVFLQQFPKSRLADDAVYHLGLIAEAGGNLRKASQLYQRAVVEFAGDRSVDSRFRLGMVGYQLGRHEEAISVLKTIEKKVRGTKRQNRVWAVMGESLWTLGRKAEAARYLLRLASATQEAPVAAWLRERGASALEEEDDPKALAALVREFKSDPVVPRLLTRLAEVRFQNQDYTGAGNAARTVVEKFPHHPSADRARRIIESVEASAQADVRTIGVALPLSGPYGGFGQKALQAVMLAAGVFGPEVEGARYRIAVRDTQGQGALAAQAVEELYIQERAMAVIGGLLTDESEAAGTTAEALGIPFISLAQKQTDADTGRFVFRNSLTSEMQTGAITDFAFDRLGAKRFAILYPDNPYGEELMNLFWDEVLAHGGEIVAVEKYEPGASDFRDPVNMLLGRHKDFIGAREEDWRKAKREARDEGKKAWQAELPPIVDFDAVFIPDNYKGAAQALGFFALADVPIGRFRPRKAGPPMIPLGIASWNNPELIERGERYVEGAYFVDAFYPESQQPQVRNFVQSFVGTYLRVPDILDALAYDSARVLFAQIKGGATTRGKLRAAIAKLNGFEGAAGKLSFNEQGEPERELTVLTVQRKEITPVHDKSASNKKP